MADVEIPPALLKLRHAFLAAQARLNAAGTISGPGWTALHVKCREAAVALQESPAWKEVEDRKAVRRALDNVTEAGGDTSEDAA